MSAHDAVALDHALARAGDGVFVVGSEGRVLLWNRAAEKILGYSAREVAGRQCCDIFAGLDDNGNRLCYPGCHVVTLVKMGEPVQNFDMRTRTKAGRGIWLNISILSVANGTNGSPVTVHLIRDVTAAKELLTLVHERLSAPAPGESSIGTLTRREVEVLRLMADGRSTKAVADAPAREPRDGAKSCAERAGQARGPQPTGSRGLRQQAPDSLVTWGPRTGPQAPGRSSHPGGPGRFSIRRPRCGRLLVAPREPGSCSDVVRASRISVPREWAR